MDADRSEVHLRRGTPADAAVVAAVFRRASLANDRDRETLLANPDALRFDPAPLAAGRTTVAEADGRVVGFATVTIVGSAAELDDLFVDPDRRRRGIARSLMACVLDAAAADGATAIEVTANEHARAFYEAVGFVDVGIASTRFGPAPRMARPL